MQIPRDRMLIHVHGKKITILHEKNHLLEKDTVWPWLSGPTINQTIQQLEIEYIESFIRYNVHYVIFALLHSG